jgi:hypothetical protein
MSLLAKENLSIRKRDLSNQRSLSLGFKKLVFAHKATAGQTTINLNSLTQPSEMASNGFANPNASDITAANILFYRNNLTIRSSLRGNLIDYLSYSVDSSSSVTLNFSAEENEIFVFTLDNDPATGSLVVDATPIIATGTLVAGLTDINVGVPFETNKFPSKQIGAVVLSIDGQIQMRNVNNATASLSADGNYEEVVATGGLGNVLRMNSSSPVDRTYVVFGTQGYAERPTGSMMAVIESVQGKVNNMASYVADAVGETVTTVLGAAPSNVDLQQFGDRVTTLENKSTPTFQKFISGSGTYALPAGVKWIKVRMVGGGGGGGGGGVSGTGGLGGTGGTTTFGTSFLSAAGGTGGYRSTSGGTGGSNTIIGINALLDVAGANGQGSGYTGTNTVQPMGGMGGSSPFGGAGGGGPNSAGGTAAKANTGSGGGGSGTLITNGDCGSGGGAGGYIEVNIINPSSSYSYSVGTGGAGGSAGTSGYAGGAGGSGVVIVEEYYT